MSRYNIPKWVLYSLVVVALAVLQLQVGALPRLFNVTPIFLIPAVISLSIFENETAGGIFGIVAGLLWDTGTGHAFGFNALFLMIMGLAAGLFVRLLFKKTAISAIFITAIFTFLHLFVTWFFFSYMTSKNGLAYSMINKILPTTLMTVVFTIPIYFLFKIIFKKMTAKDTDLS